MPIYFSVRGDKAIAAKLAAMKSLQGAKRGLRAAAVHIKGKIAQYPPATDANTPGPYPKRWYERGYGTRWARASGGAGGRRTSETLGRRWSVQQRDGGLTQAVGNNASYGPYVQSAKYQAWFHERRMWNTDERVMAQEAGAVLQFIRNEITKELEK